MPTRGQGRVSFRIGMESRRIVPRLLPWTGNEVIMETSSEEAASSVPQTFSTVGVVGGVPSPQTSVTQKQLQDLVNEVDPKQLLDEDVEEQLMIMADDFIESVVTASCQLAKHRKSTTLETKDLQLHLERAWNMSIPGFGAEEPSHRKSATTEAHKQRINLIKRSKR